MHFGVDYYPELWVHPYAGTPEAPESRWERDVELMLAAGMNVVRIGEYTWGLCEPTEGDYRFDFLVRVMDLMHRSGIRVVVGTPTAAPPLWLTRLHPEILPVNECGQRLSPGTRRACCLNSDMFWEYSRRIVHKMAESLGRHPALLAWQIDSGLGAHATESCFNEETRHDWQAWLKAKYETVDRLNELLGLRFWGQTVSAWEDVPMPMKAPTVHNPALLLDWKRFSSDTIVAYARMQAELLKEITPEVPVTHNLRPHAREFDYFDLAEVIDFVSVNSNAVIKAKSAELASEIDLMRSLKKSGIRTPDGGAGFWVIEQKAGNVDWQDVNTLVRPGVIRLFTYQLVSRGASGVLYFNWRQPRVGSQKFYGGVLTHDGRGTNRVYQEIRELGQELRRLAPLLKDTTVTAEACILYSHENDWNLKYVKQPNRHFHFREHLQCFYNALHDRNIAVDFARPTEDLSRYKLVIAPALQLLAGGEADLLKLYVQEGGTLVATFNTGLVDEHHMAPDDGFPHDLTDLFGLEVIEFDPLPPHEENHLALKGTLGVTSVHPGRVWCDIIEPKGCQVLGSFSRDFYAGRPAVTMNQYGMGRAIYIGTMSHQAFYYDLVVWLRQLCNLHPLLKVPDTVEVSLRQKGNTRLYFLLNHQNTPVRISFFKPVHDFLEDRMLTGNFDMPPHGVLVLDEQSASPLHHSG
jgi:beta-galactosidase